MLGSALNLPVTPEMQKQIGSLLGPLAGEQQFNNIVKFMTGHAPAETKGEARTEPGTEKCIILIYEGIDAVTQNPRGPRADRSGQGASRLDPARVRLDHHGQRRARLRFAPTTPGAKWASSKSAKTISSR